MTPAIEAARRAGVSYAVHEYDQVAHAAFGAEAARKLQIDPRRVFKTLIAQLDSRQLAVALVPVAATLSMKLLAEALQAKRAELADGQAAQRATGYVLGGISPLGQRKQLPTVIDQSAQHWDTMFVSAGRRGLEIEMAPGDLQRLCQALWAPIAA